MMSSPSEPPPPPPPPPRVRRIDGPMLPHLFLSPPETSTANNSLASLVPILTPPMSNAGNGEDQRYVLVPESRRIIVRGARRGTRVRDLVVPSCGYDDDDDDDGASSGGLRGGGTIRSVALAWLPRVPSSSSSSDDDSDGDGNDDDDEVGGGEVEGKEGEWVILAGCSGGIVHEWSASDLSSSSSSSDDDGGGASCLRPRRSFRLTRGSKTADLTHLASPSSESPPDYETDDLPAAVVYGLIDEGVGDALVRFAVPPFVPRARRGGAGGDGGLVPVSVPLAVARLASAKEMRSGGDRAFGLLAAYRPATGGGGDGPSDAFVVVCARRSLVVYRDRREDGGEDGGPPSSWKSRLVRLDESAAGEGGGPLTCAAISPGAADLALGREGGHVDVLHDLFGNASRYLDGRAARKRGDGGDGDGDGGGRRHPGAATVRRTLHWHSHPVRALAYATSSSGGGPGPATLLSGGEESVLVTWQLDRNFHRPSNFVSRVGRGGIASILPCGGGSGAGGGDGGGVIVFCSDDTVQRFDGVTYEREWSEQGLASMELHGGEEGEGVIAGGTEVAEDGVRRLAGRRGPIVMVRDPITNYPMLTNLPGAPGMVHWYDPTSASVVGTLEVAPFNRVSRRDPKTDPHIPTPAVTHMAVGRSGRDMVTVDAVWTENSSVGAAYDLVGPAGDVVPMNVCTSIKFWSHVDSSGPSRSRSAEHQRKRRNGDVPMGYELVSSMAAPHGRGGEVCALAVSPDGGVACTLSREEDAFRVWAKNTEAPVGKWKCHYKVRTPSGYASLLSRGVNSSSLGQQLVAFSTDGTVLSVSYGPYVTLWDHSDATLLTSLSLDDKAAVPSRASEKIQTINFLTGNDDAMLLTTASQIGVKSPFGGARSCYLGDDEWSLDVASLFGKGAVVSAVVPLADFEDQGGGSGGFFAVSISIGNGSKSVISVMNRDNGKIMTSVGTDAPIQWKVDGVIRSLYVEKSLGSSVQLLAITKDCQMLSLRVGHAIMSNAEILSTGNSRAQAPVLKIGTKSTDAEERPTSVKKRKVSIVIPRGGAESARNLSGFVFPALSGKFTCAFVAQLGKRSRSN